MLGAHDVSGTAIVVLSGGQDSTTCLWWAKRRYKNVHCITFDYGQRHEREIECAQQVFVRSQVNSHETIELGPVLRGTSPLVNPSSELGKYESAVDLPGGIEPTFVPGRNILFLTIAGNRAAVHKADAIVIGVCEADYGGYPDCRQMFLNFMTSALREGIWGDAMHALEIQAPLMHLTKKETVQLAVREGCLDELAYTHTCYEGSYPPCGKCHACIIRARGFFQATTPDPLIIRAKREGKLPEGYSPYGTAVS